MYGAEYETYLHGGHSTNVPCAVCHVSNRTAVYMVPAKYTCPIQNGPESIMVT